MTERWRLNSERLAAALAESRLSQNAWARRLGISKSYLSQLTTGNRRYPSRRVRERLQALLEIPADELFVVERQTDGSKVAASASGDQPGPERVGRTLFRWGSRSIQLRVELVDPDSKGAPGETMLQGFLQDIRFGFRILVTKPGFSLSCLLLLGAGIGFNTILFSLVHGVLLRPLPFKEPSRLMMLGEGPQDQPDVLDWVSPANYVDWKEQSSSFESMAAFQEGTAVLTGFERPRTIQVASVSPGFLGLLGNPPIQGRFFSRDEAKPGSGRVIVISVPLWRSCFGGESVESKKLTLDGVDFEVVGVASLDSRFPADVDAWVPLVFNFDIASSRGAHFLKTIARLRDGVQIKTARNELDLIAARLRLAYPDKNANVGISMAPLQESLVDEVRPTLMILWGSVTLILFIACANAANLFLARSLQRKREIAIRLAMGAARSRIARQLLTESLMLSLVAGLSGVLVACLGLPVLLSMFPFELPRAAAVQVDQPVLLYALGVSTLCGIAFGAVPALQAKGFDLRRSLSFSSGGSAGRDAVLLRGGLVVIEVALAVTLIIVAGLFNRGLLRLESVDPGFDPTNVVSMRISLPDARYDAGQKRRFFDSLTDTVGRLPGVASTGLVAWLPLGGAWNFAFEIEGRPPEPPGHEPSAVFLPLGDDYFETMGIRLLSGREFGPVDRADSAPVVIVNETLARRFFPGEDPIGSLVRIGYGRGEPVPRRIVGVVNDVKQWGLSAPTPASFYLPHEQVPFGSMCLTVRAAKSPLSLIDSVQAEIWKLDPDLAPEDVQTLEERIYGSTAGSRFRSFLASSFGTVAGLLALFGLYGVVTFATSQRAREIAIRIAIGARTRQVVAMVVLRGLWLVLAGTGLGVLLALAVSGLLSRFLFGIEATDFPTYAGAATLMVLLAIFASYLPARRAARTDPVSILRNE